MSHLRYNKQVNFVIKVDQNISRTAALVDVPGLQGSVSSGNGCWAAKAQWCMCAVKAGLCVLTQQRSYWSSKKRTQILTERG